MASTVATKVASISSFAVWVRRNAVRVGVLAFACAFLMLGVSGCGSEDEGQDFSVEAARSAYEQGDFDEAAIQAEGVLADDPDDVDARELYASILTALGRNEEAIEEYAIVIEKRPDDHVSLYRAAILERMVGSSEDAIEHLESAVELNGDPTYADELARTYMQVGRYEEAAQAWGRLLDGEELATEGRVEILRLQADAYQNAKDYESAIDALESALELAPNDEAIQAKLEALKQ